MALLGQHPSNDPTVCFWQWTMDALREVCKKRTSRQWYFSKIQSQPPAAGPSWARYDVFAFHSFRLIFITSICSLYASWAEQYIVRCEDRREIQEVQFYKEQYDLLPAVPACRWGGVGPISTAVTGWDWCGSLPCLPWYCCFPLSLSSSPISFHQLDVKISLQKPGLLCRKFHTWRHRLHLFKMCLRRTLPQKGMQLEEKRT